MALGDQTLWLTEKLSGAGRDPRLLPPLVPTGTVRRPLFSTAWAAMNVTAVPNPQVYAEVQQTSAIEELGESIALSGMEPPQYWMAFLAESGLARKTGLAIEMSYLFYSLWAMATVDGLDLRRSATADHWARRILQAQEAITRNPAAPDFTGLELYMRHATEFQGGAYAPKFKGFIASMLKEESAFLKQNRLAKEEETAVVEKRKDGKNPKGKAKAKAAAASAGDSG